MAGKEMISLQQMAIVDAHRPYRKRTPKFAAQVCISNLKRKARCANRSLFNYESAQKAALRAFKGALCTSKSGGQSWDDAPEIDVVAYELFCKMPATGALDVDPRRSRWTLRHLNGDAIRSPQHEARREPTSEAALDQPVEVAPESDPEPVEPRPQSPPIDDSLAVIAAPAPQPSAHYVSVRIEGSQGSEFLRRPMDDTQVRALREAWARL